MSLCRVAGLLWLLAVSGGASAACWAVAERHFGIEARLLQAIALTESNMQPDVTNINGNGTRDMGLMQINSAHLPRLAKLGIDEQLLYEDGCVSVMVGASILADMMKIYGYSWEAVGAYNAGVGKDRRDLRLRYARRVWDHYTRLSAQKDSPHVG
ncbi:transglycosylase SLT domain-containing protein [Martelella alba]|uniref:Invasion protein IagB n=1 Tax=Martelella alba TaxID=2590451 RepID=A0ABY2SIS3_9HYPH|nr:transglycosylase SLT domain-containing protein [Martelella alba]TKI05133.1 invasion protein IagB [Martelella alba]